MVDVIPRYLARKNGFDTFFYTSWGTSKAQASERSTFLMDVAASNAPLLFPTAETYPIASDANGRSFPAGTIGVRFHYEYLLSAALNNTGNYYIWAVPDTLPTGYLLRSSRDAIGTTRTDPFGNTLPSLKPRTRNSTGCAAGYPEEINSSAASAFFWNSLFDGIAGSYRNPYRIRTDSGLTDYFWMPECPSNQTGQIITSNSGFWSSSPGAGWRYLRIGNGTITNTSGSDITFEIRRNANLSNTGTGDTLAYSYTWANGALQDSGWITDPAHSPFGTKCYWYFSNFNYGNPSSVFGSRCDIPFPFTATGDGGLIAPGGVIPGVVPGYP